MVNISIDQLADEISQAVREYTEEVSEMVAREVDDTAEIMLRTVRITAPKRPGSGKYAKGFIKTDKSLATHGNRKYVIWNKKHFRRVHLLEFGHASRNGGSVDAIPHLRPAYDYLAERMENNIRDIIRNGG